MPTSVCASAIDVIAVAHVAHDEAAEHERDHQQEEQHAVEEVDADRVFGAARRHANEAGSRAAERAAP